MTIFKRNKKWWIDVTVEGVRFRQSLATANWQEAQSKAARFQVEAEDGKVATPRAEFNRLGFSAAVDRYIEERKPDLKPRSYQTEVERARPLKKYFGSRALSRITFDDL